MALATYDCMLILDSNRYARDAAGIADQIKRTIETHGGQVLLSRLWEERRLAYPIAGQRKGTYWLTFFKLESRDVGKIEHDFQLNEHILRSLTLKVDDRIADDLVKHYAAASRSTEARPARETERARPAVEAAAVGN